MDLLGKFNEIEKETLKKVEITETEFDEKTDKNTLFNVLVSRNTSNETKKKALKILETYYPNERWNFSEVNISLTYDEIINSPYQYDLLNSKQIIVATPFEEKLKLFLLPQKSLIKLSFQNQIRFQMMTINKNEVLETIKKIVGENHSFYNFASQMPLTEKDIEKIPEFAPYKKLTYKNKNEILSEIYAEEIDESWVEKYKKAIEKFEEKIAKELQKFEKTKQIKESLSDISDAILIFLKKNNKNIYIPELYSTHYWWYMSEDELITYLRILKANPEYKVYADGFERQLKINGIL
jgi:hypothetical protein